MHALDIYGLSEVMGPGVANECVETKDGLHVWEDHFYPEIIDPVTGEVLPDGEIGELVFTSLTKQAMPVVRYRTRDLTRLLPGTARPMRRIEKITGRTDDMIILRGVNLFPTQIEELILRTPDLAPHFQCVLTRDGRLDALTVKVERRTEADPAAAEPGGPRPGHRDQEQHRGHRTRGGDRTGRRGAFDGQDAAHSRPPREWVSSWRRSASLSPDVPPDHVRLRRVDRRHVARRVQLAGVGAPARGSLRRALVRRARRALDLAAGIGHSPRRLRHPDARPDAAHRTGRPGPHDRHLGERAERPRRLDPALPPGRRLPARPQHALRRPVAQRHRRPAETVGRPAAGRRSTRRAAACRRSRAPTSR